MSRVLLFSVVALSLLASAAIASPVTEAGAAASHSNSGRGLFDSVAKAIDCVKQKTQIDCDVLDACVWCENSKLGSACYPLNAAKLLPAKWFDCDKPTDGSSVSSTQAGPAQQAAVTGAADSTCDNKPEASCIAPDCVWCTSAAVPGGCYTPEQAKKLPAAIFKCKNPPSVLVFNQDEDTVKLDQQ